MITAGWLLTQYTSLLSYNNTTLPMAETDAEIATANQFLMSPFRMHENGDIDDDDNNNNNGANNGAEGEGADEVLSEGNAFELEHEHDPETSRVADALLPLPDSVVASSQMPSTAALMHLFRYRSAFSREGTSGISAMECLPSTRP